MQARFVFIAAFCVGAALAPATFAAPAKCSLAKVGEFHITMQGPRPVVDARINGVDARLLVDSGSFFSALSGTTLETYKLKRGVMPPGLNIRGTGGNAEFSVGHADSFEIGNFALHGYDFLVGGPRFGADINGLLGENILGATDVEYDFANGMVRLFKPQDCAKISLAYWAGDTAVSQVPLPFLEGGPSSLIIGKAKVNGRDIRVIFDTGASSSVLKHETAAKMGFKPTNPGVTSGGVSGGIGRKMSDTWVAPFESFAIGGESIKNTRLRVADISLLEADMLLGADFFLSHRIFISRSQHMAYITYNGGPVFRLERIPNAPQNGTVALDPKALEHDVGAPAASAPTLTADEYSRRGSASAARRDFAAAIGDFGRAIELEPANPRHYFDRATAHQAARQPLLAMADFDQTLKLKPDHQQALLARGEMFLNRRQIERARTDFNDAIKVARADDTSRLRVADAYLRAGFADDAITDLDAWMVEHPRDKDNPQVLNQRCWARALGNRDLDKALVDCNASIKTASANAAFLDSRGLVYLRMGQTDKAIADYDESLKRQPKSAWPLYGRGLAKLKKGQDADGRADIAQALALAPALAQQARLYGLGQP